jgi:hypothetical protein
MGSQGRTGIRSALDALQFVMRRASRYWQVLVVLALGVVLATALLASAPVLTNTVVEFGLRRTLLDADPAQGNIRLATRSDPDLTQYRRLDTAVSELARAQLGDKLDRVIPSGDARWMYPWVEGELRTDRRVRLSFYGPSPSTADEGLPEYARLISGQWPVAEVDRNPEADTNAEVDGNPADSYPAASQAAPVPVAIGQEMAAAYGLAVGHRLGLSVREEAGEPDLWIEVAGIVRVRAGQERYWFGAYSPLLPQQSAHYESQYSVLVAPETLFALASSSLAGSQVDLAWHALLDPGAIVLDDVGYVRAALASLQEAAPQLNERLRVESGLDEILVQLGPRSEAIRSPLYLLIATIMLLALYYVTMDAALSLRQFEREFAVLSSRGASGWQLFRAQLVEALLVSGVALLSGPGLGLTFVRALVALGPLADIRELDWNLWLPQASWLAALVGATGCLVSLLSPVPGVLQGSIVSHRQSTTRLERPAWWQRHYVDVFLLLAGLVLIWRVRIHGSILGGGPDQPQVDWLLLASPLALLLGSAAILLRVFPLVLEVGAEWVSRGRGLLAPLAFWRIARDPTHVARLVLLLTLAMALGLFATGLNATLDRNERDQSYYTVGSDLRLSDPDVGAAERVGSLAGVQGASAALRGEGTVALQTLQGYPAFDLLAVETATLGSVSRFRPDFSRDPMAELLQRLDASMPSVTTLPLPASADRLGLWCWLPAESEALAARLAIAAKVEGPSGALYTLQLRLDETEQDVEQGWYYYEGGLPEDARPLGLHSVWLRNATSSRVGHIELLVLGDLVAVDSISGRKEAVAGFAAGGRLPRWTLEPRFARTQVRALTTGSPAGADLGPTAWHVPGHDVQVQAIPVGLSPPGASLALRFPDSEMRSGVWYGLLQQEDEEMTPLPALVSPSFQSQCQVGVGDRIGTWVDSQPVEFEVVGTVDHFPTLYEERSAGFVVTSLGALTQELNQLVPDTVRANELLVALGPGQVLEEQVASALETAVVPRRGGSSTNRMDAETVRRAIKADPLALGLRSVALFGYLLTAVLSLAGFGTHFYLTTRQHSRTYVVLRALGLSPRQLYGMLLLEQVVLIVSGLALGTGLGLLLNRLTLPGLPLSLGERPPVPPFLAETDWRAVGRIYMSLTLAFLASLGLATGALWRVQLHRQLRVDEE